VEGPAAQAEDRPESNAPALSEGSGVPSGPDAATAGRDATLQVIARAVNLGLGVLVTAMIARTLGTEGYGEWATLLAAVGLIGYLATFGLESVAIREAARDREAEHEWLGAIILARLYMIVPAAALTALAVTLLSHGHEMLVAGLILVLLTPFNGFNVVQLVFQLRVDNRVPMLVLTLRSVLWALFVLYVFLTQGTLVELAIGLAATTAIGALVLVLAARRAAPRALRPSRKQLSRLLKDGIPVGIAGIFVIVYARVDQLLVYQLRGGHQAGLYGSVYGILEQAQFVPISIITAIGPVLAASWPGNRDRLVHAAVASAEALAIISFGALAFATVAAEPLVRLVFGPGFSQAAPALPVLGAAMVFIGFNYISDNLIVVTGRQRVRIVISTVALIVNVAGNLILIPAVGFMGAAWMTFGTEVVVFVGGLWIVMAVLKLSRPPSGRLGRTLCCALLLGALLALVQSLGGSLLALALTAAAAYPALLFGLRAATPAELRALLGRRVSL